MLALLLQRGGEGEQFVPADAAAGENIGKGELSKTAYIVFGLLRPGIDSSRSNYEKRVEKGRKAAIARWNRESPSEESSMPGAYTEDTPSIHQAYTEDTEDKKIRRLEDKDDKNMADEPPRSKRFEPPTVEQVREEG